jgi:hypothetical protein
MQKKLLIVSIYAPSDFNRQWYSLQKRFLEKTTKIPFEFKVVLNGCDASEFEGADILYANDDNIGHSQALKQVLYKFRSVPCDAYLVLDSDCFPVWDGWHDVLFEQMQKFNKIIAAPVRVENLDLFPHPSAFFILGHGIQHPKINFDVTQITNLLGGAVADVGGAMQNTIGQLLLPMLRTNVVNLHPVAAAIYHHLFYHHGSGSRDFDFRILKRYDYYGHWHSSDDKEEQGRRLMDIRLSTNGL